MIIDFTISNFRSIKTEQTFSLYAENPGSHLLSNITYPTSSKVGVLKCAGVYGANASGKSNLLLALRALRYIICKTGELKEGDEIRCYEPYQLSEDSKSAPIRFEIEFVTPDGMQYKYLVSFTRNKIIEEYLDFYPSAKAASIFSRGLNDTWETIRFGTLYKGGKKRHSLFESNAYISVAGNKADAPEIVRKVYNYFRKEMLLLCCDEHVLHPGVLNSSNLLEKVAAFLSLVDTGITGIKSEDNVEIEDISFPKGMSEKIKETIIRQNKTKFLFSHDTDYGGMEYFDLKQESSGTQKLFELAPVIIDALENGGVLVFDELDNSMHPFMAELIIKLFNDEEVNNNGAQLIFSTHNINLMSPDCFRRDQIWFTEKNDGATTFYSLEDFDKKKVKPQSPFNIWYAEGRFGGVPKIDYQGIVSLLKNSREANAKEKRK
jgi:uncharacterized protein